MVSESQVGNILYQVEMDVQQLVRAQQTASDRLSRLEGNFDSAGRSASGFQSSISKLAGAITAALSVKAIADYANAWVDVSNKLVNAIRPHEELATVTERVFKISQDTRASLEATASLYGRLERATRSAGTSTADLAKLTETINKGLVVSGATAEEASSTMIQLSQALASGVLRGEEFNSISENGSRLAVALATSLGVTVGQLRNMAAQGALTTDVVVKGLLSQAVPIANEFAKTTLTMGQAFTVATNNITKFVGESSSTNTVLSVFNTGVITLSENLSTIASVIGVFAVVMGGRFVGALTAATAARISDAIAANAQAASTANAAAAAATAATITARKALLDKEAAISALALAQAEYNVAKGSAAEAFALENLTAIKSTAISQSALYAEAQLAQAAAQNTASAAAAAATTTIGGLARGALSLIGGPAGAAVLAGAAIFYFYQKAQQAKQESLDFADKLDNVISKMKEMSQIQIAAEIDKANKSITAQNSQLTENEQNLANVNNKLALAKKSVSDLGSQNWLYSNAVGNVNALESESIQLTAKVEAERNKLSQTISKTGILSAQMNGTFVQGIDLLKRDGEQANIVTGIMNQLGGAIDIASKAKDKFNSSSLTVSVSAAGQKQLTQLQQEGELLSIVDKRQRAVKAARLDAINAGEKNQNVINQVGELAGKNYDLQQAEQARDAAAKKGQKTTDEGAQKIANLTKDIGYLALKYDENSREAAVYNAVQSAGNKATDAQKIKIGELAGALFDAKQKQSDLNAAIADDPKGKENKYYEESTKQLKRQLDGNIINIKQFNDQSEKMAQEHEINLARIRANETVTPKQQAQGSVDPVQQLANENAQKLALIQAFETEKGVITANGIALMNAANTEYEAARNAALWKQWADQSTVNTLMAGAIDSLGSASSSAITGLLTGTESANQALANIANTILNSVVQGFVEMGLAQVKAAITGAAAQQTATVATTATAVTGIATTTAASTAAAGTTLAAWLPAALVASVGSFGAAAIIGGAALVGAFALSKTLGARKNGGSVTAGGMYQVGEGGMPEIYQGSNGRQYMIPGDNGSVISNKDLATGGTASTGNNVSVNVHNYGSSQVQTNQSSNSDGSLTLDVLISDINEGGPFSQSIASNFNTKRRATE